MVSKLSKSNGNDNLYQFTRAKHFEFRALWGRTTNVSLDDHNEDSSIHLVVAFGDRLTDTKDLSDMFDWTFVPTSGNRAAK